MQISEMKTEELVEQLVQKDKEREELVKEINRYKHELEGRGEQILEDTNTRYIKYFSKNGSCAITDAEQLKVLNDSKLRGLLPDGIYDKFVEITPKVEYKYNKELEKVLKAIFSGDYTFEMPLEEAIESFGTFTPNTKQKKVLLKKLRGDYEKDRALLVSLFGEGAYDEELYYIHKIKNGELIKIFLPEEGLNMLMEEIKECVVVESSLKITIEKNGLG